MTTRKKKLLDEKEHEEEKYKFMKEQIRPQRRRIFFKYVKRSVLTLALAILFGGVSAVVFCSVKGNIENKNTLADDVNSNGVVEETPEPTSYSEQNKKPTEIKKTDAEAIYEYSKLNRRLASIGEACKYSLVTVWGYKKGNALDGIMGKKHYNDAYGAFVQEDIVSYYIVTDASAVKEAKSIKVEFYNGDEANAKLVAYDDNVNIAVIKIDKNGLEKTVKSGISKVDFANLNNNLGLGSNIIAVGAPNGVMYSVMVGNIARAEIEVGITDNQIQLFSTDIPYSSNANGVILNTRGRVIGFINHSFKDYTGDSFLGFVEYSSVRDIVKKLLEGKNIPYLGIEGNNVDEKTAKQHGIEKGVYITSVHSGSPSYASGMRIGDVITKINGVNISSMTQVHSLLMELETNTNTKFTIARKTNKKTIYKKLKVVLE